MNRIKTTWLSVCLAFAGATSAFAQEGAPCASGTCAPGFSFGAGGGACASGNCGQASCHRSHCAYLFHCQEGPVRIKTHVGCPPPVCSPCMKPNWGYYETCWNPWPVGPDFSHCRTMPPAASVVLNPNAGPMYVPGNLPPGMAAPGAGGQVRPSEQIPTRPKVNPTPTQLPVSTRPPAPQTYTIPQVGQANPQPTLPPQQANSFRPGF